MSLRSLRLNNLYSLVFFSFVMLIFFLPQQLLAKITAEQVLGEYWTDPLFGAAAAAQVVRMDVTTNKLWPQNISVKRGENVRFVFDNKSSEQHLLAFAYSPQMLLADKDFQQVVADELLHANSGQGPGGHRHTHEGSSVDQPLAIVRTVDQQPRVFLSRFELKEIIVKFEDLRSISIFCVLDDAHRKDIGGAIVSVSE